MTNGELMRAAEALARLGQERLPVTGAMRLRRITRAVRQQLDDVEAVRQELLRRHATVDEHGEVVIDAQGNAQFAGDGLEEFRREYGELLAEEVELPDRVRAKDLGSIEVTPATLIELGELLEEGE